MFNVTFLDGTISVVFFKAEDLCLYIFSPFLSLQVCCLTSSNVHHLYAPLYNFTYGLVHHITGAFHIMHTMDLGCRPNYLYMTVCK